METGTAAYYPNYGALLRRAFSSRSFYLADDGLHWFYPMYSVAPAAEGIVDFSLPYGEAGPLLPAEEEKDRERRPGPQAAPPLSIGGMSDILLNSCRGRRTCRPRR